MDLILLQPGDPSLFEGVGDAEPNLFSPPDGWSDPLVDLGQCIELASMTQGLKQQVTTDVSNSARTSGRPVISEFTCEKYVDKTSVKLYDYCLRAQPIGKGARQPTKLYVARNSGGKTANIITFSLRDAIVSEIQFQSNPNDMPTEQFKLNFTEILWTYTVRKADGVAGGTISAGWSLARNRSITAFTD
jgi:type VI secretion system secreted protein Hcp